jgi:hypothetical protein
MSSVKLSVTVRGALEQKYDAAALKQVDEAVKRWMAADAARGIRTVHVAVDDAAAMEALGVSAVTGKATAGKVKRAVDALWQRLTPDYLVLFGSHEVVPQFIVDNPSHDSNGDDDETVPTDNPYASSRPFHRAKRDSYLVPDRVVGRIPDLPGSGDPAWLVNYLTTATETTGRAASAYREAYAVCCDEWKGAGAACVRYLGEPASPLLISPPEDDASATSHLAAPLHMIKCHGGALDPQFYGQKGDAYPVALCSETLKSGLKPGTLVAAMCCYGAQVYSPDDPAAIVRGEWPIASTYLRGGAPGFAGATMIAWVGVDQMMCADWIAAGYLKGVMGGASIGRAFLESKQDYLRWISQQGQVPGLADEKTLIEFVLLGDPSVQPVAAAPAVAAAGAAVALVHQERRQRRVLRAELAVQIRKVLPVRTAAGRTAVARTEVVFTAAKAAFGAEHEFRFDPRKARVEQLETKLPAPRPAATPGRVMAAARPPASRQSVEYYWSARREVDSKHKQIRMVRVETDLEGNVLRSTVVHSS